MPPTSDLLECAAGVSAETLSALRDELLPAAEAERLQTHAASCLACQTRLARHDELSRALLAQRELQPGERIVAGVRERLGGRSRKRPTILRVTTRTPLRWSGLGTLAAAAAVLLLFVYVLGTRPGGWFAVGKATPSATVNAPTMTPAPSPTATPPLSPIADVATAWGAHAALATLTPTVGTNTFDTTAITPDGRYLLGNEYLSPVGTQAPPSPAGLFSLATDHFTPISTGGPDNPLNCCQTDGRFAVGFDSDEPGATCGVCHRRYWAYDLTTGHLREVASGHTYQMIGQAMLSAGVLVLGTGVGVVTVNLATGAVSRLVGIGPMGQSFPETFAWPYLVYADSGSGSLAVVHIRDLRTGADVALHQLDSITQEFSSGVTMALAANTDILFVAVGSGGGSEAGNGAPTLTTLYELDHAMTPGAPLRTIARAAGDLGGLMDANGRLVLLHDAAWDRAEGRFVTFTRGAAGIPTDLSGSYFVLYEPTSAGGPQQVTLFDTSQLPVRTGT